MSLLEHYRILGVSVGAGIADVTSSYKRLCRIHHPDVSTDPESEEMMKKINVAYTVLREKFKREAAFRERMSYTRSARRYGSPDFRPQNTEARPQNTEARPQNTEARPQNTEARPHYQEARPQNTEARKSSATPEKEAYTVLHYYFKAINSYDYAGAYYYLSSYDKRHISRESFIEWRKSVARLYPMREFKITGGLPVAAMNWGGEKILYARRFRVAVIEETYLDDDTRAGDIRADEIHEGNVEKLVIYENGSWKVFLGYMSVRELTRTFDERFENKWKLDIAKRWDEYYTGLYPEYDMLSLSGMHKAASREIYRKKRFGCAMTFAAISIKNPCNRGAAQEQLLRSAAKTICGTLRETDVSAYAGDGVFALLLVELRKKYAGEIVRRLVERIRKNAGTQLGARAEIEYEFESWGGNVPTDIDALNKVLIKFRKKM